MASRGTLDPRGPAVNLDLPAVDAVDAEDGPRDLGPSRADESRDTDDLSASDLERDVAEDSVAAQPGHLQRDRTRIVRPLRELLRQLPAHHQSDQFPLRRPRHRQGRDQFAVTQDRDPVTDAGRVFQMMGNEDDRGSLVAQRGDDPKELVRFFGGDCRGWLVEDQDARFGDERLGDLRHLLQRDAEAADLGVGIE